MDAEQIAANALKTNLKEEETAMEAANENAQMQHLKRSDKTTRRILSVFLDRVCHS